jgi:glycerophosphoryl diester phosphodiesterase
VAIARPHFLALGIDMLPSAVADDYRQRGLPVVAWTIRAAAEWEKIKAHCDNMIFEGDLA